MILIIMAGVLALIGLQHIVVPVQGPGRAKEVRGGWLWLLMAAVVLAAGLT